MTPFVYIVPLKTLKVNVKSVKINNKLESNMLNKNRKVDVEKIYKGFIDNITRTLSKNI